MASKERGEMFEANKDVGGWRFEAKKESEQN
jgi:hypothetical protein